MLISLLLCWPLGPHVWPLPSKSQWEAVNLPCGCLGAGAVRTLVSWPTLQCAWAPQVIHDWLTWGPNFKTLCNHMLPFLCHPSLKAGEISLAMNVWNSLPASGVTGPHGVYNKHWMKVCPVSWRFQEQREDELEMLMKPHFSVLSTRNHRHILAGSCVTWLLESQIVVQGPAASSSPGSLLEMKTLSPPTSGWITTCTFTRSPEDPHAH